MQRCFKSLSPRRILAWAFCTLSLLVAVPSLTAQAFWTAVGPAGGDARAFASVPGQRDHLYLGTTDSWIYESLDQGATWRRLAKLGTSDDLVLDSIVVDESN